MFPAHLELEDQTTFDNAQNVRRAAFFTAFQPIDIAGNWSSTVYCVEG